MSAPPTPTVLDLVIATGRVPLGGSDSEHKQQITTAAWLAMEPAYGGDIDEATTYREIQYIAARIAEYADRLNYEITDDIYEHLRQIRAEVRADRIQRISAAVDDLYETYLTSSSYDIELAPGRIEIRAIVFNSRDLNTITRIAHAHGLSIGIAATDSLPRIIIAFRRDYP